MNIRLRLFQARRWMVWVIVPTLLVSVLGYMYAARHPKLYTSTATLYVSLPSSSYNGMPGTEDVYMSQMIAPTYQRMIVSPAVLALADKSIQQVYPGYFIEGHGVSADQQVSTQLLN